jgi:hypothetical protein
MPKLDLVLGEPHLLILDGEARFNVINAGRGFGKTQTILGRIFKHLQTPYFDAHGTPLKHKVWYIAPTYKQGKTIFWDRLKEFFWPMVSSKNEVELSLTLKNGAEIRIVGSDNSDNLRGPYLTLAVFDEFAFHRQGYWSRVIRPMLGRVAPLGGADFYSTPDGQNEFYELFIRGDLDSFPDWDCYHFTSLEGGFISQKEINAAAHEMTHEEWRQEYFGDFIAQAGRVYYLFDQLAHCGPAKWLKNRDIHWFWDFNEVPHCHSGLAHIGRGKDGFERIYVFDEICKGNTPQIVEQFIEQYPRDQVGQIYLYGDAYGDKSTSGITDFTTISNMLVERGYQEPTLKVPKCNPYEKDRVNSVNVKLKSASGTIGIIINDENCKKLLKDFISVKRNDAGKIDKISDRKLTHISDAFGYFVWSVYPVLSRVTKKTQAPVKIETIPETGYWVDAS